MLDSGRAPDWNRLFFTDLVDRNFDSLQEIERLLCLALPLGLPEAQRESWPNLVLPPQAEELAARLFANLQADSLAVQAYKQAEAAPGNISDLGPQSGNGEPNQAVCKRRPVLGLHPGSVWGTKRWPWDYFALLGVIALRHGVDVLLFAGPGEEEMAAKVHNLILAPNVPVQELAYAGQGRLRVVTAAALSAVDSAGVSADAGAVSDGINSGQPLPKLLNLAGALSLPELAACLGRLDCYLTNDSGPMHLAWAQGTPVVALFGPTVRELGFAPRGKDSTILEVKDLNCRPCGLHGPQSCPKGHHHCMTRLHVTDVWEEVRRRLNV